MAQVETSKAVKQWLKVSVNLEKNHRVEKLNAGGFISPQELPARCHAPRHAKLSWAVFASLTHLFRHHAAAVVIFLCARRIHAPYH